MASKPVRKTGEIGYLANLAETRGSKARRLQSARFFENRSNASIFAFKTSCNKNGGWKCDGKESRAARESRAKMGKIFSRYAKLSRSCGGAWSCRWIEVGVMSGTPGRHHDGGGDSQ